jgi:hypothetical protein
LGALTRIVPANPASKVEGQPGAIESPVAAPVRANVIALHRSVVIELNVKLFVPVRNVGIVAGSVES